MSDHIHMLVNILPKISVSSFMGWLKGKSALMMFDKHANPKYKFGNIHLGGRILCEYSGFKWSNNQKIHSGTRESRYRIE